MEAGAGEPLAIVFFPEGEPVPDAVLDWQSRNPDWRRAVDRSIICPVCGLGVRAIADFALLDDAAIREAVRDYRERHLRRACSDHYLPTEEYWAVVKSGARGPRPRR